MRNKDWYNREYRNNNLLPLEPVKNRLRAAWHCLRGRPVMYRVIKSSDVVMNVGCDGSDAYFIECDFRPRYIMTAGVEIPFLYENEAGIV